MRLWIDTDVGDNPDDAVALVCADAHPDIELVGVSTVDGDHARRCAAASSLVEAPVVAGDDPELCDRVRAAAVDALLAIGPLTNVAVMLNADAVPERLGLMGGALGPVHRRGRLQPVEHNFARDPNAAARVLAGRPGALVVPLDVTVSMRLDQRELERVLHAAPTLRPALEEWLAREDAVCLHDPLALLALGGEPVVTTEQRRIAVEPDGRVVERADATEHDVVIAADATSAIARIVDLLGR